MTGRYLLLAAVVAAVIGAYYAGRYTSHKETIAAEYGYITNLVTGETIDIHGNKQWARTQYLIVARLNNWCRHLWNHSTIKACPCVVGCPCRCGDKCKCVPLREHDLYGFGSKTRLIKDAE